MLGGLLEDTVRESEQKVPILGSIPLLGALFRVQQTDMVKTNLMVFIRPKIMRDTAQSRFETNTKYNAIRDVLDRDGIQLMPGAERPTLPPLEEVQSQPAGSTDEPTGVE